MWVAKEKAGDNNLDCMAIPEPETPPVSPPLPSKTRARRSSLAKTIQRFRKDPGGGGESAGQDRADDGTTAPAVGIPPSSPGEGSIGSDSCEPLEEGRTRLRQDLKGARR